jgi:hypothetical protein
VVGGYRSGNHGVDALLVGVYDRKDLTFAGKVRAGFTPHGRREVFAALEPLHTSRCPFVDVPTTKTGRWGGGITADEMSEMQWVKPTLVVQIRFVEWMAEGLLAAFGLSRHADGRRARCGARRRRRPTGSTPSSVGRQARQLGTPAKRIYTATRRAIGEPLKLTRLPPIERQSIRVAQRPGTRCLANWRARLGSNQRPRA